MKDATRPAKPAQRLKNPLKYWKFSEMDLVSRAKWKENSKAKDEMFEFTDTEKSPWYVVDADDKRSAKLTCIDHLFSIIDYSNIERITPQLPPLIKQKYKRPPLNHQNYVLKKIQKMNSAWLY